MTDLVPTPNFKTNGYQGMGMLGLIRHHKMDLTRIGPQLLIGRVRG
jgi:hypothetical protein